MKKIIALCLLLVFALGAAAETTIGLPNPVTEYASLDEINEIVGSNLTHMPVMGVTDERFTTVETEEYIIAQYEFSVNGLAYTMRCAAVANEDISGVYLDGKPAFGEYSGDETEYAFGEGMKLSRWFDLSGQYVLCVSDAENVMDEETFKLITQEARDITCVAMSEAELESYYAVLAGDYEDSFSQRAHLSVTANGAEGAAIEVYWADSASAGYEWKMTVKLAEDGLLYYTDCACVYAQYDEQGAASTETVYENGEGFFSFSEGKLFWNGAAEENCQDCVFEKGA